MMAANKGDKGGKCPDMENFKKQQENVKTEFNKQQLLVHSLAASSISQTELLDTVLLEEPDDEDGSNRVIDPADYPEPRYGYVPDRIKWEKSSVPIEAMSGLGHSFILRRLTEMIMSQKALDEVLMEYHQSLKWPKQAAAGTPPVKQYPFSSQVNKESIEAISVHATGTPRRLTPEQIQTVKQRFATWGVVVIQNLVPEEACDETREWLLKELNSPEAKFGNVRSKKYRKDMPLNISTSPAAGSLFKGALASLEEVYEGTLGKNAVLVELSSLVSLPKTKTQRAHPDAGIEIICSLFTTQPHS